MDILNNEPYGHIKTEEPYVEPTVQNNWWRKKKENEDYLQTAAEFIETDMAATAQKRRFLQRFFDAVIDLPDPRKIIDDARTTVCIFIDDNFLCKNDIEVDDKQVIDHILKVMVIFWCYIHHLRRTLKLSKKYNTL